MEEVRFKLNELPQAVRKFINSIGDHRIFLFDGEMGSGKTTFIAEICKQLGAKDDLGSPTFSLVNEYADLNGNPIYHFDMYRIESEQEVVDMGAEEYFNSGALCFVEWPGKLGRLKPEEGVTVRITVNPDNTRTVTF